MQSLEIQIVDQILVRGKIAYYTKKRLTMGIFNEVYYTHWSLAIRQLRRAYIVQSALT